MVKIVKLHNNVEIIGNIDMIEGDKVVVDNPFTINYMVSPRSERPIVGLLRYMPFAEHREIEFRMSDVLHVVDARKSMSNYYTAVLTTHMNEIDDTVDRELEQVAELEASEQNTDEHSDLLSAMLERINSNNNLH